MKAFVCLGKAGDILSAAPIFYHEFWATGRKPVVVVSREYYRVIGRMNYIEPFIWENSWTDLKGAIKEAKKHFEQVVVAQIFGKDFPFQHKTPSFQLDQWVRAGCVESWDNLSLVLPRPRNAKELAAKHLGSKSAILYADHSQSSPFPHKEKLAKLLHDRFGADHSIVRLSEIRLENPLDLLALLDAADLLVTIETMALHLSAASGTPVIALVADKPGTWNGSAWSKRFRGHFRYGDFERRTPEIIVAAESALAKSPPRQTTVIPTEKPFGYNPSGIEHDGRQLLIYRYHPENNWKTQLAIEDEGSTSLVGFDQTGYSLEDPNLFHYQGKLWCAYVLASSNHGQFRCVMEYGQLLRTVTGWSIGQRYRINYGRNNFSALEKNWAFFESDGKLFCLYGQDQGRQIVLQVEGNNVAKVHTSPATGWAWSDIHGGAFAPFGDKMLRFFHSRVGKGHTHYEFTYYIGAAVMDATPPFATVAVGKFPILAGTEKWTPDCHHWKPRVVFSGSAQVDKYGFTLTYGNNDCECCRVSITEKELNL
jgi:hypothetical protein